MVKEVCTQPDGGGPDSPEKLHPTGPGRPALRTMKIEESKIGFIGQGAIGRRLIDHGFRLSVYDRTVQRMDQPVTFGATAAESASALSVDSDVVMSCVTNDDAVLGIYGSARGAMSAARPGTIVVEMSTVLPGSSIGLSRLRRERAVEVLDVPISGSTPAAEEGTLVLFAGGDRQTFDGAIQSSGRCRGSTITSGRTEPATR